VSAPRIAARFVALAREGRAGLVTYLTCGDPDAVTFAQLLAGLPAAGADLIEIGMPFSDPMADGPAIQAASLRALKSGMTLRQTLAIVRDFRTRDVGTPIVLMGYYNPIYRMGVARFLAEAKAAGIDGLIIVDLPPSMTTNSVCRRCMPGSTSSVWRRRPPTMRACRSCCVRRRASSITSRSPASPAPPRRRSPRSTTRWRG